jgi:hypothetical protein
VTRPRNGRATDEIPASLQQTWRACNLRELKLPQKMIRCAAPSFDKMIGAGCPQENNSHVERVAGPGSAFEAKSAGPGRPKELKLKRQDPLDSNMISLASNASVSMTTLKVDGRGVLPTILGTPCIPTAWRGIEKRADYASSPSVTSISRTKTDCRLSSGLRGRCPVARPRRPQTPIFSGPYLVH